MTDKLQEITTQAQRHFFGGLVLLTASRTVELYADLADRDCGCAATTTWELTPDEMEAVLRRDLVDIVV